MLLISFAWKNIWRNKTRSIIILSAIAIGLFGGLFSSGFMKGMVIERLRSAIENETANIQIHNAYFLYNKELQDTIENSLEIAAILDTMQQVEGYATRLKITAMVATATTGTGIMLNGIDSENEKMVSGIYRKIPDSCGTWFSENRTNSIVIGRKLAEKLKIRLKSKIIVTFQTSKLDITSTAFKVTGMFETDNSMFDEKNVFVRKADILPLIGLQQNAIHEIAILLKNDKLTETTKNVIQSKFPKTSVQTWKEIMPDLGLLSEMINEKLYIILIIILLALCFGIINTMMMAVLERTHEIGMLLALGMKRRLIFQLIVLETIFLSLTGAIIGMAISYASISYFEIHGINLGAFAEGISALGFNSVIYPSLDINFYVGLTILVFLTGIFSSILPARRALKLNPVEAIRIN